MINKRGISPIIATVLLLGFTVALATTVFLWMQGQTKTMSESTVEYAEGEMQCQNVRVNVVKSDGTTCGKLDLHNKGYLKIKQLSIKSFDSTSSVGSILYPTPEPSDCSLPSSNCLKPQSTNCKSEDNCGVWLNVDPQNTTACNKIEVMPIIQIQTRKVGCKDRTILVKCS
ncbi:MAG: hypothetical protein Q8O03_05575 [Nanoarchaeota archaeon]|nr:hypothetical protein [Nanoarchaeota archaeon]